MAGAIRAFLGQCHPVVISSTLRRAHQSAQFVAGAFGALWWWSSRWGRRRLWIVGAVVIATLLRTFVGQMFVTQVKVKASQFIQNSASQASALAFLDAYARGSAAGRAYLASDNLAVLVGGGATWARR